MKTQNPNLITVFSPTGESAEVSKANARDLTQHSGWSYERLVLAATPAPAPAPAPVAPVAEPAAPVTPPAPEAPVAPATDLFTTVEQFEGYDREAVVAYLAKHFPDFKPHHKSSADSLIGKAIEMAAA